MKRKMINAWCLMILLAFFSNAYAGTAPFTITGNIKGLREGTKLQLVPGATHQNEKPVALATVVKGRFVFKGTLSEPRLFYVQVAEVSGALPVMVQSGKIILDASATLTEKGDFYEFTNVLVKGSAAHTEYLRKVAPKKMLDSLFNANSIANAEISKKRNEALAKKDTVLAAEILKTEAWKKLETDEGNFFKLADQTLRKAISDNKDSWWGPFLALDLFNYFTPQDKPMYEAFSQQAKDSYYGQILKELINPEGFMGKNAPAVAAKDEAGTAAELVALTKGHQYVLVDFWASWCVPCRKSIPKLKKAYEELNGKGLQIVSISIDKDAAAWKKAQGEEKLPWPSFLDQGTTADAWKVRAIPAIFLLDANGVVVAEDLSVDEMIAKIKEI